MLIFWGIGLDYVAGFGKRDFFPLEDSEGAGFEADGAKERGRYEKNMVYGDVGWCVDVGGGVR